RVSLRVWLGFGENDLAAKQYGNLYRYCRKYGRSPIDVLHDLYEDKLQLPYVDRLIERYALLLAQFEKLENKTVWETMDSLFPKNVEWTEFFRNIIDKMPQDATFDKVVETIDSGVIKPEIPRDVNYVRIMSLQSSKGLTANHVIVLGCISGLIPS